jgi:hypothetical protein
MQKSRGAHRQGHAPPARDKALPHHWLISPAWRYALSTFDRLEKERRRSLKRSMETIDTVEE